MSKTLSGRSAFKDMKVFNKYASSRKKFPLTKLPKFVLYSGHCEQVYPMLRAMKTPLGVMPPAASRVYFKFYSCKTCDEKYWVKPVYAPFAHDESK